MKKLICTLLATVMIFALTACGNVGGVSGGMPAEFEEAGYTQEEYDALKKRLLS